MRSMLALAFAFSSLIATAQQPAAQPAPNTGWDTVRALTPGSSLDIKLRKGGQKCAFRSADADSVTCNHGTDLTLQRADILRVKVHHRGRSTLAGLAIGAGAGAGIGYASGGSGDWRVLAVDVLGVGGGAVGAITGFLTDFTRSVVYKAN